MAKSFALLELLVENAGRLLDRDTTMAAIWPDAVVSDESVSRCVRDVRKALGAEAHRLPRTVPRRGYLFAVKIVRTAAAAEPSVRTAAPAPVLGPERRRMTVLLGDLVDSTPLRKRLDPEDFGSGHPCRLAPGRLAATHAPRARRSLRLGPRRRARPPSRIEPSHRGVEPEVEARDRARDARWPTVASAIVLAPRHPYG